MVIGLRETVQLNQQLRLHPTGSFVFLFTLTRGHKGVHLVHEDGRRSVVPCHLEQHLQETEGKEWC